MSLLDKASLILTPNAVKESKVYSIIPSNGNGDLTFTRATTATLTNNAGLIETVPYNLLTYSEQFDNASFWTNLIGGTGVNPTRTANTVVSPNGTLTADTIVLNRGVGNTITDQSTISQLVNIIGIDLYTFSFWVKATSISDVGKQIFIRTGNSSVLSPITLTENWVRYMLTNNITIGNLGSNIFQIGNRGPFTNSNSVSVDIWGAQLVQGSVPKDYFFTTDRLNVPRLNYDSVGGCPSLLLEPQRTNLFLNSVWAGGGSVPTSWSSGVPTGTATPVTSIKNPNVTAYRFVASTQRIEFSQNISLVLNSVTCLSVYVESITTAITVNNMLRFSATTGTGNSVFLKNNIVINGATNIEAGNTYSLQFTVTLADSFTIRVGAGSLGNVTCNFVLSMPQLEQGASSIASYSTSFIPTTTTALTRNTDVITRNNIYTNNLITSAGGTWFIELNNVFERIRDNSSYALFLSTTLNGFGGNGFIIYNGTSNSIRLQIIKFVEGIATGVYNINTNNIKLAIKWNGVTADIFANEVKVVASTPFTSTSMQFLGNGIMPVPLNIKSMLLFPTPLTDAECIALTQ